MNRHRRGNVFQEILLWIFLLGFLLGGYQTALAQENNEIHLSARPGLDGYCKNDAWIPVQITVANSGPDLDAHVEVSYQNSNGRESITGAEVSLPSTSQKEFFLYLYPQYSFRDLKASLLVGKKTLAEVDLKVTCLSNDNLLVGLITDNPSNYIVLNEIETLNGSMRMAQLQPENLPDQPEGWDGLDILVLGGQDMGTLSLAQQQGLRTWLANGGKMLIVGGLKWQNTTSGLEDLLPITLNSTRTVDSLSALEEYSKTPISSDSPGILAVGQLHTNAEVLVEQDGFSLIAQKQFGLGIVYFLAADPGLQPLAKWEGMKDIYSYLFAFKTPKPVWSKNNWGSYDANNALSTLSKLSIPPIIYICGWLVFYVVVIGPVNYLVLRRMKRGELAWLTIPALVIIFTCIAYFYGFIYRGTKPILNRLAVVQAWEGSDQAKARGLVGLYSPNRGKYTLEANDQFRFYPFADNSLQTGGDWQTIQKGTISVLPDTQVEIGGMKTVSVEGSLPAMTFNHDLVLTIDSKTPVLRGTITNTSDFTLKDAILVTPGALKRLGDLAPFSPSEVNVSLVAGKDGPQIYTLDAWNLLGINNYYGSDIDQSTERQASFLRATLYSDRYASKTMWGIYLMGWVDEPLLPVGLQGRQFEAIDTTLFITMLSPSLNFEGGTVNLPPNMFIWEASIENISPYYTDASYIPKGGYTISFRPAVPVRFNEVKLLTLHMESSANPGDILVSLWDFEQEEWVQLKIASWGDTNIPEPWRYVDFDGEIRLQIDGDQNDYLEVGPSNFTLVVEQ